MTSSFRRIDLGEVLERCHRQPIDPSEDRRRECQQQQYRSLSEIIGVGDNDDDPLLDDNASTVSFLTTSGWDRTIMDQDVDAVASWQQRQARGRFLTPHAMAMQSWVYGTEDRPFSGMEETDHLKIRWKTLLAPHRIFQIASNEDGSIIAATTDNGAISIIRGRDGKVLATRRLSTAIAFEGDNGNSPTSTFWCPHVSFLKSPTTTGPRVDALLVQLPSSNQPPLLVSNIQGDRLNSMDDSVVAQATQSMNLDTIQVPSIPTRDVVLMEGYVPSQSPGDSGKEERPPTSATIFRFVLIHEGPATNGEKRLALADYNLSTQQCDILSKNRMFGTDACSIKWEIDERVGIHLHPIHHSGRYLLAVMARSSSLSPSKSPVNICWLDPDTSFTEGSPVHGEEPMRLKCIREHTLKNWLEETEEEERDLSREMQVLAFSFVHSCDVNEAAAVAIILQIGNQTETRVIQSQVKSTPAGSSNILHFTLGPVHQLYSIPLPASTRSTNICALEPREFGPYSFRAKVSAGWNIPDESFVFQTASDVSQKPGDTLTGSSIGLIRLHTMLNNFSHARALVHNAGLETLLLDEYAGFHPAEIALQKLKQSLLNSSTVDVAMREALKVFERGSGHAYGQRAFLEAAEFLLFWPAQVDSKMKNISEPSMPTFSHLLQSVSMFIDTMKSVSELFFDEDTQALTRAAFEDKLLNLEKKLSTITYIAEELRDDSDTNTLERTHFPPELASVLTLDDLFCTLLADGNFEQAEKMLRSFSRTKLSAEGMIEGFLRLSPEFRPHRYMRLLKELVLPNLSISHELLPVILTWSCSMADDLDDRSEDGIDDAITLLMTVEQATKTLRRKIHDSFAYYSPFVDRSSSVDSRKNLAILKEQIHLHDSSSGMISVGESAVSDISMITLEKEKGESSGPTAVAPGIGKLDRIEARPNPTILEIGRMKRGAQKTTKLGQVSSISRNDTVDDNEDAVEAKLEAARWLQESRMLGIRRCLVTLRDFSFRGGESLLCRELIQLYSSTAPSHEARYNNLHQKVLGFCNRSRVVFDDALKQYAKHLCEGKSTSPAAIEEAASIARCCQSPTVKCQVTLNTLRSALFCRFSPAWLTKLSKDAIEWSAGDSTIRSELEEASRLLLIDEIVGRYCGDGAKELFHVDNPLHASRLLEFVCNNFHQQCVLTDVLDLCDAFHHLSVEDGCGMLLQNTILSGNQKQVATFLKKMYNRSKTIAHLVCSRALTFCLDLVDDYTQQLGQEFGISNQSEVSCNNHRKKVLDYTSCATRLTKIALSENWLTLSSDIGSGFTTTHYGAANLKKMLQDLERIQILQSDFDIFLRISDLAQPERCIEVVQTILSGISDPYKSGDQQRTIRVASQARRVSALLVSPSETDTLDESKLLFAAAIKIARNLALASHCPVAMDFIRDLGILDASQCEFASRCCLSLSLTFCLRTTQTYDSNNKFENAKGMAMALSLLQDYALLTCKDDVLECSTSLSTLIDVVAQVLYRADEGCGEQLDAFRKSLLQNAAKSRSFSSHIPNNESIKNCDTARTAASSSFHPTWYVGDGLLLPPEEALMKGIEYCKQSMGMQLIDDPSMGIESFVVNKGGRALALRLLTHSMTTQLCLPYVETPLLVLMEFSNSLSVSLVERYLGGTGTGITNGLVDSQLALSHLVSLPIKVAFQLYKSTLPTAINTRDFPRVVSLATVGKVSGSPVSSLGVEIKNAWSRQLKFVNQCDTLATRAHWWYILEDHGISFDPRLFEQDYDAENKNSTGKAKTHSYAASLIPKLISATSSTIPSPSLNDTLDLISHYSSDFSLSTEVPISLYVRFLLNPVKGNVDCIQFETADTEGTVRKLLYRLDDASQRLQIIRSALIDFEDCDGCTDYERLSVILSLYQTEMSFFLSGDLGQTRVTTDSYFMEMELIDRRRDALTILLSFYEGDKKILRPPFSDFFQPLSTKIGGSNDTTTTICCYVLGWEASNDLPEGFDPLRPLEATLRASCSSAVASALSPLCLPLGVPRGYVRTRSLIAKFQTSKEEGAVLPPYDEVDSVLKHLRSTSDVAELAEWCSSQYQLHNPSKLKCLHVALEAAIKASNAAERSAKKGQGSIVETEESFALARVKRVSAAKDLLADRLSITTILQSAWEESDKRNAYSATIRCLQDRLEEEVWSKIDVFVPEQFVEALFTKASCLACDAALSSYNSISVGQLRKLSYLTHRICCRISERYSHVQIGEIARRLSRRWLLFGHEQMSNELKENNPVPSNYQSHTPSDANDEDTINFQMDLSKLQDDSIWGSYASTGSSRAGNGRTIVATEETSSIRSTSLREISEDASIRCALRIAFVTAFSEDYRSEGVADDGGSCVGNEENTIHATLTQNTKTKRRGLLSKVKASKSTEYNYQHELVLQHCRELLRLVFATSTSTVHAIQDVDLSFATERLGTKTKGSTSALTFAMRHRTLRVAAVLVPQDALEQVLRQEYSSSTSNLSLKNCTFGVFCAKELEEMHLPIPHSDLGLLSEMHFPSYARALWRHHRDIKGGKGRLLLLIIELYLREQISDYDFFVTVVKELGNLRLPRTLLLAFECTLRYAEQFETFTDNFIESTIQRLTTLLSTLLARIFSDLKEFLRSSSNDQDKEIVDEDRRCAVDTVFRFGQILFSFCAHSKLQDLLTDYCTNLLEVIYHEHGKFLREDFTNILHQLIPKISAMEMQKTLLERLDMCLLEDPVAHNCKES